MVCGVHQCHELRGLASAHEHLVLLLLDSPRVEACAVVAIWLRKVLKEGDMYESNGGEGVVRPHPL